MSYLTVADVAEFTTTELTLAPAVLAMLEPAWALRVAANFWPFWSSEIFCAAAVWPLKKASQFAVICALEPEPELLEAAEPLGAAELLVAAGDVAGAEAAGALDGEVPADGLELPHAATAAASARPSAGAVIRQTKRLNRTTRLLCLGRMCCTSA